MEPNKPKEAWEKPEMRTFGTLAEITGGDIHKNAGNSDVLIVAGMDPIPIPGSGLR